IRPQKHCSACHLSSSDKTRSWLAAPNVFRADGLQKRRPLRLVLAFHRATTYFVAQMTFAHRVLRLVSRVAVVLKSRGQTAVMIVVVLLSASAALPQESLDALQKRAEKGSAEAQTALGTRYRNGEGVHQDLEQAAHWFRLAATQGYAE